VPVPAGARPALSPVSMPVSEPVAALVPMAFMPSNSNLASSRWEPTATAPAALSKNTSTRAKRFVKVTGSPLAGTRIDSSTVCARVETAKTKPAKARPADKIEWFMGRVCPLSATFSNPDHTGQALNG